MIAEQMNLFCQKPAMHEDDDRIVKMENGTAYLCTQKDIPDDLIMIYDVEFEGINYYGLEKTSEIFYKTTECLRWKDLQKKALKITNKYAQKYHHISVAARPHMLGVLDYHRKP